MKKALPHEPAAAPFYFEGKAACADGTLSQHGIGDLAGNLDGAGSII